MFGFNSILIERRSLSGHAVPGVTSRRSRCARGNLNRVLWIAHQVEAALRNSLDVSGWREQPVHLSSDHVARAAVVGCYDTQASSHGFEEHFAESLEE